jgi:hypothetical protein
MHAKAPTFTATLYRSGNLTPAAGEHAGSEKARAADAIRPSGRVGRTAALFCSPTLTEMATWHLANLTVGGGHVAAAKEIRYAGPEPYAYPVSAWPVWAPRDTELADYWKAGRPLSQALADPQALLDSSPCPHVDSRIEILIDPRYVVSARPVSAKRVVMAADIHIAKQLEWHLHHRRAFKGNTWRDYSAMGAY